MRLTTAPSARLRTLRLPNHTSLSFSTKPKSSSTSTPTSPKWFDPSTPNYTPSRSFNNTPPRLSTNPPPLHPDHTPPEERQLNLGTTLRTLQRHLPGLLTTPLPASILSPSVALILFPSTHPHLPVVRGRMAYIAALWTAPVAWGHLPGVGVRLKILSEKMVGEDFVVRWQTTTNGSQGLEADVDKRLAGMPSGKGGREVDEQAKLDVFKILRERRAESDDEDDGEGFGGLFVFSFDEKGRIAKHVIEHTDRGREEEGSAIISVTEWLLRKAKEGASSAANGGGLVMGCAGKDKS
ncbi:hypothetical protein BJ508DRAFT_412480 [Ascobolus immersus RN42]|uniref:Uncharacterized protein n=1 Tax=Ascobolus immersus RN42 TaxID=1160509 RepID=A0A3N4IJ44_ASCIM|nr:hypothetical protein BJ508DRAFT_412480 [Ascobolus immersus RN42]